MLFKLNQYEVADKLTSRILETARTNKSNNIPSLEYLRAYCQEHLGQADDAVADYFNAANHFMQSAVTNAPALLCLKRASHISSQKMKTNIVYDLSVLKPPREGVEEIKAVVEKLVVQPDCFNVSVLEKIIDTNRIDVNGIRGRFISTPFPYLPLVRLHCITRDQLYLGIDPKHCCLFMSDLKKIFANCERVDYANHETNFSAVAYKVAGGTLTLTERREGFPAIMAIRIETPHTASSRLQPLTPADYRQSVSRLHEWYKTKLFLPESGSSFNSTRNP